MHHRFLVGKHGIGQSRAQKSQRGKQRGGATPRRTGSDDADGKKKCHGPDIGCPASGKNGGDSENRPKKGTEVEQRGCMLRRVVH